MRKERFPASRRTKLHSRGDGPFQVKARVGDNAYILDLPGDDGVSTTFNVADLSPFEFDDLDSRMSPFQQGGNDEDIEPPSQATSPLVDPLTHITGPMIRSKSKSMQNALAQLIQKVHDDDQVTKSKESISCTVLQVISTSPFSDKKSLSQRN